MATKKQQNAINAVHDIVAQLEVALIKLRHEGVTVKHSGIAHFHQTPIYDYSIVEALHPKQLEVD